MAGRARALVAEPVAVGLDWRGQYFYGVFRPADRTVVFIRHWSDDSPEPFEDAVPFDSHMEGRLQVLAGAPVDLDQSQGLPKLGDKHHACVRYILFGRLSREF